MWKVRDKFQRGEWRGTPLTAFGIWEKQQGQYVEAAILGQGPLSHVGTGRNHMFQNNSVIHSKHILGAK